MSDDVPDAEGEELEMVIFDISRAHFMAPMDREACTELPQEETARRRRRSGFASEIEVRVSYSKCKLAKKLASNACARLVWQTPLCFLYNAEEGCRGGVHGDDFVVVGSRRALDRMARLYLASTPCENRTDLVLGITVNATLSC